MTIITTVAELDVLPVGTPLTDRDDDQWQKLPNGRWAMPGRIGSSSAPHLLRMWAPLTCVEQPELSMTRCVYDACASTHPLPPGSTWACPQHGDQHHNITLGRD
jgi:hypothetical protein